MAVVNWVKGATHNSKSNFSHRECVGLVTLRARILVIVAVSYIPIGENNECEEYENAHRYDSVSQRRDWQFAVLDEHTISLSK
jgi:hypothetical protein